MAAASIDLSWSHNLVAGRQLTLKLPSDIFIVHACLGEELPPPTERARGSLLLKAPGCDAMRSIASFARDTCERVALGLQLDAEAEYTFITLGPFPIDLFGYYRDARSASRASKSLVTDTVEHPGHEGSEKPSVKSSKRKGRHDDDDEESESDAPGPLKKQKHTDGSDSEEDSDESEEGR